MSKIFTITEGLENLGALRTGGQGSVYKGRRMGAIYSAVKLIPTPITEEDADDKNYRNFQNEVAKLQKVNENPSPNVVKMLSFGITDSGSFPFIEMEYIDGPDLSELLAPPHEKIFTIKELVKVGGQLAAALAHSHKVGVKHGDIKSNNVKYNVHTGNYMLLDFGLAIMSEEQRRSSIRHAGAIEFMAPEQNEGKMLLQTDVYSYGIILYELLAGQVPFPLKGNSDTSRNTVMLGHMENELPDAMELRKANLPSSWTEQQKTQEMNVPAWVLTIIDKCLQKDPNDRFPDGMTLNDSFEESMLTAQPQLQTIENLPEPTEKSGVYLSSFAFTTLMVVLLALVIYSGYSAFTSYTNPAEEQQVSVADSIPLQADTATYDPSERTLSQRQISAAQRDTADSIRKAAAQKEADTTEDLTPDTTLGPQTDPDI